MPRNARKKSETGIYHVMLRGINKQNIFIDEKDKAKFLYVLKDCKPLCGVAIFAYCILDNHAHILIKEGKEPLDKVFKRIGVRYVYYFNRKYSRTGTLFQDRFKSEPVDDDSYLLTVLRYIHQNPVKAGLCGTPDGYRWSSYNDYAGAEGITDTGPALLLLDDNREKALKAVLAPPSGDTEACLDISHNNALSGDELDKIILRVRQEMNTDFSEMDKKKTRESIDKLKSAGLSLRQISSATGFSFYAIRK